MPTTPMPTTPTPSDAIQQRANALASGIVALDRLKPADAMDGEALAVRLANFIMTGEHPDLVD